MAKKYDFAGWATKNDLLCTDGRTIRKNAFKDCDGLTVPLVYQHDHSDPTNVLGHCLLENRDEGVYCYGKFNETPRGQHAKIGVKNGDITGLSIFANNLQQRGGDVIHGEINVETLLDTAAAVIQFLYVFFCQRNKDTEFAVFKIFFFGKFFNIRCYDLSRCNKTNHHEHSQEYKQEQRQPAEEPCFDTPRYPLIKYHN